MNIARDETLLGQCFPFILIGCIAAAGAVSILISGTVLAHAIAKPENLLLFGACLIGASSVAGIGYLPGFIARRRKTRAIFPTTILGLVGMIGTVGWIVAMVWALSDKPSDRRPEKASEKTVARG